jgi:hypothetical protein
MKSLLCLIPIVALLLTACSKEGSPSSLQTNAAPAAFENPLNAPADYGKALVKAQKSAEKTVDLAALTKAIEMFQVDKGRLPKDLNELVTGKFIGQMPPAPPGMKIVYDASTGEVKVQPQ